MLPNAGDTISRSVFELNIQDIYIQRPCWMQKDTPKDHFLTHPHPGSQSRADNIYLVI